MPEAAKGWEPVRQTRAGRLGNSDYRRRAYGHYAVNTGQRRSTQVNAGQHRSTVVNSGQQPLHGVTYRDLPLRRGPAPEP
eukprot:gene4755-biopygen19056